MTTKQRIYQQCLEAVNQRLSICEKGLMNLQESLASETKSSVGDKHETGRAMIQLEREQLGGQLAKVESDKEILLKINPELTSEIVRLGSLVKTSEYTYFIAISSGKITIDGTNFYSISLDSPMGQLLIGKRVGEKFQFRENEIEILEVQ